MRYYINILCIYVGTLFLASYAMAQTYVHVPRPQNPEYNLSSDMDCVTVAETEQHCFVRAFTGTDEKQHGPLLHMWSRGTLENRTVFGWEEVYPVIAGKPNCLARSGGRIDCFFRTNVIPAPDDRGRGLLDRISWNGTEWTRSNAGVLDGTASCLTLNEEEIDCFMRRAEVSTTSGRLRDVIFKYTVRGNEIIGGQNLGATLVSNPNCLTAGPAEIHCFAQGSDKALWHNFGAGERWAGWASLSGRMIGAPSCTSPIPSQIHCFIRGTDNQLWHSYWNGSRWNIWVKVGGEDGNRNRITMQSDPDCFTTGDGLYCTFVNRQLSTNQGASDGIAAWRWSNTSNDWTFRQYASNSSVSADPPSTTTALVSGSCSVISNEKRPLCLILKKIRNRTHLFVPPVR